MKDPIEDFVRRNRKEFDDEKPSDAVWQKLAQELPTGSQERPKKDAKIIRLQRRFIWAAAAAVVFFIISIGFWLQNAQLKKTEPSLAAAEEMSDPESAEADELDMFNTLPEVKALATEFTSEIDVAINDLKAYPNAEAEVKEELAELDQDFESLKQELGNSYSPKEIVEAMIDNYRIKLEILESTLSHLKRSSEETQRHEIEI